MSLKTAQSNFKKAFLDEKKTLTEKFLVELKVYLQKRKDKERYSELLDYMNKGEPLASFLCRNDICDDLVVEMLLREIPFVLVTNAKGEYGFIIRSSDRALTNEAIKTVLKRLGNYCEIVTGEELVSIVQRTSDTDKGLVAVSGLDENELLLLEKLCKKKGFLDYIAEDKMSDGTHRFMAYGKKAAKNNMLAVILFEMVMKMEGTNKDINKRRLENEKRVENLRLSDFNRNKNGRFPLYIVGSGNQCMKITQDGFQFGYGVKKDGDIKLAEQFSVNINEPSYKEYETSFLNRIPDPAVTNSIEQVKEHLERRNNNRDSLDFGLNSREMDKYIGEKMLIASVMAVVNRNTVSDDIMNVSGRWMEKTSYITSEAGRVLQGLINHEIPFGYDNLDMKEAGSKIAAYSIDLKDYSRVATVMQNLAITNERGSLELKGSLTDRISGAQEKIIVDEQESKIGETEYEYTDSERSDP